MFYRCVDSFPVLPPYTGPPVSYRAAQVQCQRPAPALWQYAQICPIKSSGDTAASYGIPLILQDNNVSMNFKRTLTLWPFTICAYPKGTRELRPRASEISPLYNFLPSEGWSREAAVFFLLLLRKRPSDAHTRLMPGIYQVCRGEGLNASVRRPWNVTRSIFSSTGMKYNFAVLVLQCFHFLRLSASTPGKCFTFFAPLHLFWYFFCYDCMMHQSQNSTVFNTFLLLPLKSSKKKNSEQRCR